MSPAGLVLAAGAGRRLGRPKALVELDGELLVDRAVGVLTTAGCDPVVVVLGAAAADVVHAAELRGAVVVVNEGWESGMASSLGRGLTALADLGASAAVVLLVDQPDVAADAVRRVVAAYDGRTPARATYGGRPGHPVVLPAARWPDIVATARGEDGARAWFAAHADELVLIACDDLGSGVDVDTAADLERFSGGAMRKDSG